MKKKSNGGNRPSKRKLKDCRRRYIRIVTHAMGSFVGHNEVEVFAFGMIDGFDRFLHSIGAETLPHSSGSAMAAAGASASAGASAGARSSAKAFHYGGRDLSR